MDNTNINSRRKFLYKSGLISAGLLYSNPLISKAYQKVNQTILNSKFFGVQMGVITYSFRSMKQDVNSLIRYCKECNINAIELMGDSIEVHAGKPKNTSNSKNPLASVQYRKDVINWRRKVSMKKFKTMKSDYFHEYSLKNDVSSDFS